MPHDGTIIRTHTHFARFVDYFLAIAVDADQDYITALDAQRKQQVINGGRSRSIQQQAYDKANEVDWRDERWRHGERTRRWPLEDIDGCPCPASVGLFVLSAAPRLILLGTSMHCTLTTRRLYTRSRHELTNLRSQMTKATLTVMRRRCSLRRC
jgi:hypothetical protein